MNDPANYDDVIDSRDIIGRLEDLLDMIEDPDTSADDTGYYEICHELRVLGELQDECVDYAEDWEYGATLVRDSYFETYAEQFARDCYELPTSGPASYIDWDAWARDVKMDYTSVEFDGVTYWTR